MVGHHQAVSGDERSRAAAIESHRGLLQVLEPSGGGLKMVLILQRLLRWIVKQPHSFVGVGKRNTHRAQREQNDVSSQFHGMYGLFTGIHQPLTSVNQGTESIQFVVPCSPSRRKRATTRRICSYANSGGRASLIGPSLSKPRRPQTSSIFFCFSWSTQPG